MAGFERGVRPMGDWSMATTLSTCSTPSMPACWPGVVRARWTLASIDCSRMSLTSVDFPEPDTPVTATKRPSGKATSMPWRLCSRAPRTTRCSPDPARRLSGTGIERSPDEVAARSPTPAHASRPVHRARRRRPPRRAPRRRGRCPPRGRPRGWSPRRARPRSRCCPGRAGAPGCRAGGGCRAGAARWRARRARRARRPAPSRSGWPAGCAGPRPPTRWRCPGPATGSRARRRAGTACRARTSCSTRSAMRCSRSVSSSASTSGGGAADRQAAQLEDVAARRR